MNKEKPNKRLIKDYDKLKGTLFLASITCTRITNELKINPSNLGFNLGSVISNFLWPTVLSSFAVNIYASS